MADAYSPGMQTTQPAAVMTPAHVEHAAEPSGAFWPVGQGVHAELPVPEEKWFTAQNEQVVAPERAKKPASHSEHPVAPIPLPDALPAAHWAHADAPVDAE